MMIRIRALAWAPRSERTGVLNNYSTVGLCRIEGDRWSVVCHFHMRLSRRVWQAAEK